MVAILNYQIWRPIENWLWLLADLNLVGQNLGVQIFMLVEKCAQFYHKTPLTDPI